MSSVNFYNKRSENRRVKKGLVAHCIAQARGGPPRHPPRSFIAQFCCVRARLLRVDVRLLHNDARLLRIAHAHRGLAKDKAETGMGAQYCCAWDQGVSCAILLREGLARPRVRAANGAKISLLTFSFYGRYMPSLSQRGGALRRSARTRRSERRHYSAPLCGQRKGRTWAKVLPRSKRPMQRTMTRARPNAPKTSPRAMSIARHAACLCCLQNNSRKAIDCTLAWQ